MGPYVCDSDIHIWSQIPKFPASSVAPLSPLTSFYMLCSHFGSYFLDDSLLLLFPGCKFIFFGFDFQGVSIFFLWF